MPPVPKRKGIAPNVPYSAPNLRCVALQGLLSRIVPVPEGWLATSTPGALNGTPNMGRQDSLGCLACNDYTTLIKAWRKALKWTPGLDCGLSVALASVTSTALVGDQLWIKLLGPPASGKTTIIEGIGVNRQYTISKSSIRGFHSGYKTDDGIDNALITKIRGMTLITKDGDTLLKSPNLTQILSEARDIYDGSSSTHYRNAVDNEYKGIRMTWLLCGTSSLREIDSSELGARFLDCVVMEGIDDELEDEIGLRVAHRAARNVCLESDGEPAKNYEPDLAYAMQLTGGYVQHLRDNAVDLLSQIDVEDEALARVARLAKFVACMRARPSKTQEETQEREFSARLVSQLVRLATCMAVVLNRSKLDDEVMRRVAKVAMDTSRGQTLQIVEHLSRAEHGMEVRALAIFTSRTDTKTRDMLRFLRQIGVVELLDTRSLAKLKLRSTSPRWRLTQMMHNLYVNIEASE